MTQSFSITSQLAKDCFKYSFFPRTIPEWNQLPLDVIHADSLDSFKNLLYQYYNM